MPEEDTKYFGSFKDKTFKPAGKTILFVCETRKEAAEIEIKLHDFFDVAVNPKFANKAKAISTGFDRTGVIAGPHTEEQKRKNSETHSGENNPNYGRTGALHPQSKAVIAIEPDGTQRHFGSGREAVRESGIDTRSLRRCLKTGNVVKKGKFKDWQVLYENP